MKRIGNIYDDFASYKTILAAFEAIKRDNRKKNRRKILRFQQNLRKNINRIVRSLRNGTWHMHPYRHIIRREANKLRDIWYSPSFDDLIVQRALCMTIGARLNKSLIKDTYAGIPGKSMQKAVKKLYKRLKLLPKGDRIWVYKSDFYHFYMSIDHSILKNKLQRKIKDKRMLSLLFDIIDTSPLPIGIPIGNMMSTVFANFYLSDIDHMQKPAIIYYRYNDDIVAISTDKNVLRDFRTQLHSSADDVALMIKQTERLFPLDAFGLDFIGYIIRVDTILIRRRVERCIRKRGYRFHQRPSMHAAQGLAAYWGRCKHSRGGHRLWFICTGAGIKHFNSYARKLCTKNLQR